MSTDKIQDLDLLLPSYLHESVVPEFIKMMIDDEGLKQNPTSKECFLLSEVALEYKVKYHIITRGDDKRYKVPEQLSSEEVAVLAMLLFTFKSIYTRENASSDDTLLGMYVNDGVKKGLYNTSEKDIRVAIKRLSPNLLTKDIDNAYYSIDLYVSDEKHYLTKEEHLIPVNNGVYNKQEQQLIEFSPDFTFLSKIPVDYKPGAINLIITDHGYEWDVESWLSDLLSTPEEKQLIWQVIADTIQVNKNRKKSVWFYANKGNNGKGTVGQLIKNLHGAGNYSSLNVAAFADRFAKADLLAVNCNIADENNVDEYIDKVDDYKASITGDDITIDRKFQKPLTIQFRGTNIQMMNGLPRVKDKTDSFTRRLLIVPFLRCFTNNGEKSEIKQDYVGRKEVLEYVLKTAIELEFEDFIVPKSSKELLSKFEEDNNPVQQFWNEFHKEFQWALLPSDFLYELYGQWYRDVNPNGKRLGKNSFLEEFAQVTADELIDSRNKKVSSNRLMDADEPLITDYYISKYMVSGNTLQDRRNFTRKDRYRGFLFP